MGRRVLPPPALSGLGLFGGPAGLDAGDQLRADRPRLDHRVDRSLLPELQEVVDHRRLGILGRGHLGLVHVLLGGEQDGLSIRSEVALLDRIPDDGHVQAVRTVGLLGPVGEALDDVEVLVAAAAQDGQEVALVHLRAGVPLGHDSISRGPAFQLYCRLVRAPYVINIPRRWCCGKLDRGWWSEALRKDRPSPARHALVLAPWKGLPHTTLRAFPYQVGTF